MSLVQNIWLLYDTPFATGNDWEIFIEAPSGGSAQLSFDSGATWVTTSTSSTLGSKSGFKYTPPCYGVGTCTPPVSNGGTILARKLGESDSLISTVGMVEQVTGGDGYTYAYTAYCTGSSITVNIGAQYATSGSNNYQLSQTDTNKLRLSINGTPVSVLTQWSDSCPLSTCHWMQVFDTVTYSTSSFHLSFSFSDSTSVVPSWNSTVTVGTIANPCTNAQNTFATAVNDTGYTGTIGVAQTINVSTNDSECNRGITTYRMEGAATGASVSLSPTTGVATVTPTAASWNFQYAIYCDNVKISTNATVSGTAVTSCVNVSLGSNSLASLLQVGNSVTGTIVLAGTDPFVLGTPTNLPAGTTASLSGNTITLIENTTIVGNYNYSIPVTNCVSGALTITGTIAVTSQPICTTPSVANVSPATALVGTAYVGSVVVSNATSVAITGLGNGLVSGTPVVSGVNITIPITGTPTSTGTLNIVVSATNNCGGGSSTSSISGIGAGSILISNTSSCPTSSVTSPVSIATGIVGSAYTASILVSNATVATITNLPSGLFQSYNGSILSVSGVPVSSGTYNLLLTLTNNCGGGNTTTTVNNIAGGTLTVNGATTADAKNDTIGVPVNGNAFFDVKANNGSGADVLCNNGTSTTFVLKASPSHGTISGFSTGAGTGIYTPNASYVGTDTAIYGILCNGVELSSAIITFNTVAEGVVGLITGEVAPYCGTQTAYTFTQSSGSAITAYNWTVGGGTIVHGANTSSILVKWDVATFGSKTISLTVLNPNGYNFTYPIQLTCAAAVNDSVITKNGDAILINVGSNDAGCNLGTSKWMLLTTPVNGAITFQNPFSGIFTYVPNKNFYGNDSFTYGLYCNSTLVDKATVMIRSINEDPCWNKSCNPCWTSTTTWKCVNERKLVLHTQTNLCYKGEPQKWVDSGACQSCSTCH